jgi:hypothetical protein
MAGVPGLRRPVARDGRNAQRAAVGGGRADAGGLKDDPWLGSLARSLWASAYSPFVSQRLAMFIASMSAEDMACLRDLMQSGRMRSVIDGHFTLADVPGPH